MARLCSKPLLSALRCKKTKTGHKKTHQSVLQPCSLAFAIAAQARIHFGF
jgi:hypothetical protein